MSKKLVIWKEIFEIKDRDVPSQYFDLFHELWLANGMLSLAMGTIVLEGDPNNPVKEARTRARLRVPLDVARRLYKRLGDLLASSDAVSKEAGRYRK